MAAFASGMDRILSLGFDYAAIPFYVGNYDSVCIFTLKRTQIISSFALLLLYWAAMQFIRIGSFGGGDYTPEGNLCEGIDRALMGRFRDGAEMQNGTVVFAAGYYYTWILSSLNFVVTVMSGMFAGYIAKSHELAEKRKVQLFLSVGAVLVVLGWTWNMVLPVIFHRVMFAEKIYIITFNVAC